ncbi:MAG: hypothetical protein JOZ51_25915 [Chloroflexi bacterium]|nr:hypothetical protein [Chloroflexota bacterium]
MSMLLAACANPPTPTPRPPVSAQSPAPSVVSSTPAADPAAQIPQPSLLPAPAEVHTTSAVDWATAWGNQLQPQSVPVALDDDQVFVPITITPDGHALVGSAIARQFGTAPGRLVLYEIQSRAVTELRRLPTPMTQVIGAAVDQDWVVWSEAAQQPNFVDWTLYAYNRATRETKQVAAAPTDQAGKPISGPYLLPRLDRGVVVWAEGIPGTADQFGIAIKTANLASGAIESLSSSGLTPAISWPHIAWVEIQAEESAQAPGARMGRIVVQNLESGQKATLQTIDTPLFFNLYGDTIVWINVSGKQVVLTDLAETRQQVIAHTDDLDETFQFPTINERLVAWVGYKKAQVWDRRQQRLITLEDGKGQITEFVNGQALAWAVPGSVSAEQRKADRQAGLRPNDGQLNVLNTSQLPGQP